MGRRIDPRQQFSKWLAKSSAWLYNMYLPALLAVICIRPEAATACVYLAIIVSFVRIFDAGFYTKNSTTEKVLLTALDKTRLNLALRNGNTSKPEDEEDASDGGGNG